MKSEVKIRAKPSGIDGSMTFEVTDVTSRKLVLEVTMPAADFMRSMSGLSDGTTYTADWGDLDRIGWQRINMSLFVPGRGRATAGARVRSEAVRLTKTHGGDWTGHEQDAANHHRSTTREGVDGHLVTFVGLFPAGHDVEDVKRREVGEA